MSLNLHFTIHLRTALKVGCLKAYMIGFTHELSRKSKVSQGMAGPVDGMGKIIADGITQIV